MQQNSNRELLSKQRKDIITKYHSGPIKSQVDDWENPQYSIYATTDYYGFIHDGGFSDEFLLKESKIKRLDCKRETKWRKLIGKKPGPKTSKVSQLGGSENQFSLIITKMNDSSFREEITKRVYKGIPKQFKSSIWHVFLDITSMKNNKPKVYQIMLKKALEKSPDVQQIDLDVNRTFRNTTYFRDRYNDRQKALLHVLAAYSMYNTEIGYCQGMSEIGGLLLMYLVEEEDVFWGLSQLMTSQRWCMHGMFVAGFPRLLTFFTHLNVILQKLLPKIAKHFEKLELMSSAYALKWFMQCFLDRVPFTLFLRVWDIYLLEGEKLLIAMAYNILKMHRKRIIKMDHCTILQFFQNDLRKDFLYDDDFVVESLKACIEELRKHKLSVPPPTQSYELPTRPFGTDLDFQTPSLASIKERQIAQANPEEVLRRSIKKQKKADLSSNSVHRISPSRSGSEEKTPLSKSDVRETNPIVKDIKIEIDNAVPSQIRYRISHRGSQVNPPKSLLKPSEEVKVSHNHDNHSSLTKKELVSGVVADRHFIKSVPDLSNSIADVPISKKSKSAARLYYKHPHPPRRASLSPDSNPTTITSNHRHHHHNLTDSSDTNSITKSKTMSSIKRPILISLKRRPLSSSPETVL